MDFEATRIAIAETLQTVIISNSYIHLDLWSFVHFFSGMLLILILSLIVSGFARFSWLFILLLIWEGFEYFMYGILKSIYFAPEKLIDTVTDVWVGMLGGIIMAIFLLIGKLNKSSK